MGSATSAYLVINRQNHNLIYKLSDDYEQAPDKLCKELRKILKKYSQKELNKMADKLKKSKTGDDSLDIDELRDLLLGKISIKTLKAVPETDKIVLNLSFQNKYLSLEEHSTISFDEIRNGGKISEIVEGGDSSEEESEDSDTESESSESEGSSESSDSD
jgi:hypothetical protein